eukprot:CAMPEP_0168718238 /NCGR_PEP_ID=MMETSP0724-20121128/413_1 /TAXON_ID=265536 /ORGANISM="Amphiprora sp., Strain CCMP467" /LENGTH=1037 /DNA_ID=CAMNT_0008764741 /DNA_START=1 /DNA_END=3115 /DNA_ORIENTATION=-
MTQRQHVESTSPPMATSGVTSPLLPMNMFGSSKVYGRQAEKDLLLEKWQKCCQEHQQELVVISAPPGSGKTALVHSLRPYIKKERQFFLFAKFADSRNQSKVPYDVFVTAFTSHVTQLMNSGDKALIAQCRQSVQELSDGELDVVIHLIPALEQLARRRSSSHLFKEESGTLQVQLHGSNTTNRLRNAFSHMVASLCKCTPILLFLDDIQWSNAANMELLQCLIDSNRQIPIMVVAALRSDALNSAAIPQQRGKQIPIGNSNNNVPSRTGPACLDLLRSKQPNITSMKLSDLTVDDINVADRCAQREIAIGFTARADNNSRAEGNVFHLMQLLRFLVEQGVIVLADSNWTWDDTEVEEALNSSGSIFELVADTIKSLSRPTQEAMKVASCLGSEIDCFAVDQVLQTSSSGLFQEAAAHGLLEFDRGTGGYRFSHDLIQQSAFGLIAAEEQPAFLLNVGQRLWRSSSASALDENMMFIVSLINEGSSLIKEERERYKVAELNLKAGLKARAIPSFTDASTFFLKGIQLLGPSSWEDWYLLSLQLHSNAAISETMNGNHAAAASSINEVVQYGATLDDKLLAYSALARCMVEQENLHRATDVCIDVLHQLGEPFPSKFSKLRLAKEFVRVRRALGGKSDADLLNLPRMADNTKKRSMPFLLYGFFSCSLAKSPLAALFALRLMNLTLRCGLHESSSVAFASYAFTLSALQYDADEVYRFGQVAFKIVEAWNVPEHLVYVLMLIGCSAIHVRRPVLESIQTFRYAGTVGIETGFVTPAISSLLLECVYMFSAGWKLVRVRKHAMEALKLAHLYHQRQFGSGLALMLQMIICLNGNADNPCIPNGIHVDFDKSLREARQSNDEMIIGLHHSSTMRLAYIHGNTALAAEHLDATRARPSYSPLYSTKTMLCDQGLASIALCRKNEKYSENLKYAKKQMKVMEKLAKKAPSNFLHRKLLLEAEIKSLTTTNKGTVSLMYEKALAEAREQNNLWYMAIACERHGDFCHERGQSKDAQGKWKEAADHYLTWGAVAKYNQLKQRFE